ncbi:hypothetical protein GCM10022244_41420 [Streptomyces gulbargensis]|uniref:Putative Flp pilus-assembly TadG-like N-terminal domain-containing protein n=1 Tax=Streptomyces gulbargensis TaxID=364901 RepID=A0ABP7MR81_9ACTN
MAGLLFLSFVYFVVGQAAALRSDAQTAADAAALAAVQNARDQLRDGWLAVILDPGQWPRFVEAEAEAYRDAPACDSAIAFAARNDAVLARRDCVHLAGASGGYRVTVRTVDTVGSSTVPGTEHRKAVASAAAVIVPKCSFTRPEPEPEPEPAPGPSSPSPDVTEDEEPGPIAELVCDDLAWEVDPDNPTLPPAEDLFTVHLTDHDE